MSFYCKQWIIQLYFEWNISYGRIAKVLVEEGLKVTRLSGLLFPTTRRMELYLVYQEAVKLTPKV